MATRVMNECRVLFSTMETIAERACVPKEWMNDKSFASSVARHVEGRVCVRNVERAGGGGKVGLGTRLDVFAPVVKGKQFHPAD